MAADGKVVGTAKVAADGRFTLSAAALDKASHIVIGDASADPTADGDQFLGYRLEEAASLFKGDVLRLPKDAWGPWFGYIGVRLGQRQRCFPWCSVLIDHVHGLALVDRTRWRPCPRRPRPRGSSTSRSSTPRIIYHPYRCATAVARAWSRSIGGRAAASRRSSSTRATTTTGRSSGRRTRPPAGRSALPRADSAPEPDPGPFPPGPGPDPAPFAMVEQVASGRRARRPQAQPRARSVRPAHAQGGAACPTTSSCARTCGARAAPAPRSARDSSPTTGRSRPAGASSRASCSRTAARSTPTRSSRSSTASPSRSTTGPPPGQWFCGRQRIPTLTSYSLAGVSCGGDPGVPGRGRSRPCCCIRSARRRAGTSARRTRIRRTPSRTSAPPPACSTHRPSTDRPSTGRWAARSGCATSSVRGMQSLGARFFRVDVASAERGRGPGRRLDPGRRPVLDLLEVVRDRLGSGRSTRSGRTRTACT